MKIIIHGKNIELTPAIKAFVEEKVGVLAKLVRDPSDLVEARVEVGKPSLHHKSGPVYYAEINLKIGRKLFRGSTQDFDLYIAIGRVRDEVEIQIKKFKGKQAAKRRK